jgi:hypothetical protein
VVNDLSALVLEGNTFSSACRPPRVHPGEPVITDGLLLAGHPRLCGGAGGPLALTKPNRSRVAAVRRVVLESWPLPALCQCVPSPMVVAGFSATRSEKARQYAMALK